MRAHHFLLFGLASSILAAGCGGGNSSNANTGGAAGSPGGSAGSPDGGNAGSPNGGNAGSPNGGDAGSPNGGNAGSPSGGNAGAAGSPNGGSAGSGTCANGTADCNNDPSDGCEVNTYTDVNNCGMCGAVCTGGGGAPPSCNIGTCGLMCAPGTGDCNNNKADGCEADLNNDPNKCGTCGITCMGSPCIQGACACAAETQSADLIPLDLFIMLDQSGSMDEAVQGGGTKWTATTGALKGFITDPANVDLGVGIQYFALQTGGMVCPPTCVTDVDCLGTPCFFGQCLFCNFPGGDSCNIADYAKADVEIAPLSGAQINALNNSINAHSPLTGTPTGPALAGAIQHAKSWKMAHPGHEVAVVLATDGLPQECDPQDIPSIANIAAAGVNGNPSILSYVIGVGSSLSNLNAIAAGGGTGMAFLVEGANVQQQLKDAFKAIQKGALGCEYTIPQPMMGMLDYSKVNVKYTDANGVATVIPNVMDAAACNPMTSGWYYDNNAMPSKIIVCDPLCNNLKVSMTGKVEVLLGCATEHM